MYNSLAFETLIACENNTVLDLVKYYKKEKESKIINLPLSITSCTQVIVERFLINFNTFFYDYINFNRQKTISLNLSTVQEMKATKTIIKKTDRQKRQ